MNRLIQWFVENPIAANLLMLVILIGGASNLGSMDKEVFPSLSTDRILISIPYPGAGPLEVEEQIVRRVEEAVADLDGIKEITSESRLALGQVTVEMIDGYDLQRLINNIKTRVDAITTFPADAERPQINEVLFRVQVMSIGVFGDVDATTLKHTGQQLRDQLALLPGISMVELSGTRDDEMAIEISEANLRHYNLSFDRVAAAIRASSLNLPAGIIKTAGGDIQLQTRGQAYTADDFARIELETREDGSHLLLGDVATIRDTFTEANQLAQLNGKPAVFLELFITDNPNVLASAASVHEFLQTDQAHLPAGIEISVWRDWSELFASRMNLLLKNSISGLILVFIVLMLFLRPQLALWVSAGIGVAFMGAFWLLPWLNISLNMVSMFAFLMVLGIVVDDAIIVGESIYSRQQSGLRGNASAAGGAKQVAKPVLFAVISTMIFFVPLLFIPGAMGEITYCIPVIVILALFFSMLESLLILPSHLAHMQPEQPNNRFWLLRLLERWREHIARWLEYVANQVYTPFVARSLNYRYATICGFLVAFALSVTLYTGGWMERTFMPQVPSDFINATIKLPDGAPFGQAREILERLQRGVEKIETDGELFEANQGQPFIENSQATINDNSIVMSVGLVKAEARQVGAEEITRHWKQVVGSIPEAEDVNISYTINEVSKPVNLRLSIASKDSAELALATQAVKDKLALYPGVYDIRDTLASARTEIELELRPYAQVLGVNLQDIARQLRQGFYGEEVQRIPRGEEDVKVMVRYPLNERATLDQLDAMRIRTSDGREVPLTEVASIHFVPGYTRINHIDRRRSINISAEIMPGTSDAGALVNDLIDSNTEAWKSRFNGFSLSIDGDMKEETEFMADAGRNFILAIFAIYGLMAVGFRSYSHPLLILTAVPFGFMGAIIGHLIMGREVSMMSILGFFACAGVVVNDNLVLVDRINQLREQGLDALQAAIQAGRDRFRAILLTSLTTFIGLVPIMSETSTQSKFLVPMVISLAFGVMFATTVTLLLVPALYVAGNDLRERWQRRSKPAEQTGAKEV